MKNMKQKPYIDLLNCEGPKTKFTKIRVENDNLETFAGKAKYEYDVTDEFGVKIAHMTLEGVKAFVKGDITLVDSKGNSWHYPTRRGSMGLTSDTVNEFFGEILV